MSSTNGLEVTNVKFSPYDKGALKAWAAVEFNGCLTIEGFKIFTKGNRTWANVPSDKKGDDYFDKVRFPKTWYGKDVENPVLDAVVDAWNNRGTSPTSSGAATDDGDEPW